MAAMEPREILEITKIVLTLAQVAININITLNTNIKYIKENLVTKDQPESQETKGNSI